MKLFSLGNMWDTSVKDYCGNDLNYRQRLALLDINGDNLNSIHGKYAESASGITNRISEETYKYDYSYTEGMNYLESYARYSDGEKTDELIEDKSQNKNNPYRKVLNLYYDDDGTGNDKFSEQEKIGHDGLNDNSILAKTKKLFNQHKMTTIISPFHTRNDKDLLNDVSETARTKNYALSHGRNLLKYGAENGETKYMVNGYENPYCRVWTHHHKYSDMRARLIRPFSIEDEKGNLSVRQTSDVNDWDNFSSSEWGGWAWRSKNVFDKNDKNESKNNVSGPDGYKYSVLNNRTGTLNIAPKFLGGKSKNIHTKDCMFSIENLAWQGYDPYSFENALSWEQRGPFGGRIMWFPPYGLRFNEDTSVNWNEHQFIGRGESVYTYTNTSRSGTLEFMMVVDHPSIVDYTTWFADKGADPDKVPKDTDIMRFFAGCDGGSNNGFLQSLARPMPLTDEYTETPKDESVKVEAEYRQEPIESPEQEVTPDEEIEISFYAFFPNNYSGYYDNNSDSKVDPVAYLLMGNGAQWKCGGTTEKPDVTTAKSTIMNFDVRDISDYGVGYEMYNDNGISVGEESQNYIIGTGPNYGDTRYIQNNNKKWYYRIDGEYVGGITYNSIKNTFGQTLEVPTNYKDSKSYHLNCDANKVKSMFKLGNDKEVYSLAEVAVALCKNDENADRIIINSGGRDNFNNDNVNKLKDYFGLNPTKYRKKDGTEEITAEEYDEKDNKSEYEPLSNSEKNTIYKVTEIDVVGYSNSHGSHLNKERNEFLARERANTIVTWFKKLYDKPDLNSNPTTSEEGVKVDSADERNVNGPSAKKWRSAKATIKITKSTVMPLNEMNNDDNVQTTSVFVGYKGFKKIEGSNGTGVIAGKTVQFYTNNNDDNDANKKGRKWYYDEDSKEMILYDKSYVSKNRVTFFGLAADNVAQIFKIKNKDENVYNRLRYDKEYYFFKELELTHKDVFDKLVEKLQYFDPAFHSMTPEGFMGRLTFLQQCTRQGDTIGASDANGLSANNLAFGRPPFCVLRLGDFYYQKIVIRNINITYDPLVLDLNQEGVGVVPLIANVTLSFNFIGGGDLTGPVRRLQNAMSFNYYANTRLYDNRADRVSRGDTNWETMGAMGNDKVDFKNSYFHQVPKASH